MKSLPEIVKANEQPKESLGPFTVEDITDCMIIVKANGLHWSLLPADKTKRDDALELRVELAKLALYDACNCGLPT